MSGVNDNTPTPLLDNIQTPTNSDDITQNTLTLAMIRELIESKKKQEKEIEELKRLLSPKDKDDNNGLVNVHFDDFLMDDAPSTIQGISPTKKLNKQLNFFDSDRSHNNKDEKYPNKNKNLFPRSPIYQNLLNGGIEIKKEEEDTLMSPNDKGNSSKLGSPFHKEEEDETVHVDFTNSSGNNNNNIPDTLRAKWTVPMLGKKNYVHWKKKVDWLLKFKNLHEFVEVRFPEPERNSPYYIRFNEAYVIVANSVSDDVMLTLGELQPNPYDLYNRIKEINNPITASSRLVNRIKYFQIKCNDSASITKFCSNIEMMSQKIDSFSLFTEEALEKMSSMTVIEIVKEVIKVIDEADRLAILLGGLPDDFETQANILRADPKTTYTKAKELLEAAAFQFKSDKPSKKESIASVGDKKITCNVCKKPGHKAFECR